jgi:hypothetical protein
MFKFHPSITLVAAGPTALGEFRGSPADFSLYLLPAARFAQGNGVAFMHAIHGSDHHVLAFAQSTAPGMHHCSWDVAGIDEIGLGAMSMADKGYQKGWGLGRHVLGSNALHPRGAEPSAR